MNSADTVEKKKCARCTIMNLMLIITAIAIVALMSSCVPPSSVREGRVVGFDQTRVSEPEKEEIKKDNKDMSELDRSEIDEALKVKALQETFALTEKKEETPKEEETPKLKPLEDQISKLKVQNDITNERVNVIQRDIREIKEAIKQLQSGMLKESKTETASTGPTPPKAFTLKSDEEAAKEDKDDPIVITASNKQSKQEKEEKVETNSEDDNTISEPVTTDFTLAEKYLEKKDYHRAIRELIELEKSLNNEVQKAECQYLLGESHYNLKQYAKAIHYFVKVLQTKGYEDRDKAQVMLAESHIKAGEATKAKGIYKDLLSENPRSEFVPIARKMLQQL